MIKNYKYMQCQILSLDEEKIHCLQKTAQASFCTIQNSTCQILSSKSTRAGFFVQFGSELCFDMFFFVCLTRFAWGF